MDTNRTSVITLCWITVWLVKFLVFGLNQPSQEDVHIVQQLLVAAAAEGGKIFALRRSLSRGLHTRVRGIQSGGRASRKADGAQKKIARPRFARSGP